MSLMVIVRGSLTVTRTHCRFGLIDVIGFAGASRIFTRSGGGDWYVCWDQAGASGASVSNAVDRARRREILFMDARVGGSVPTILFCNYINTVCLWSVLVNGARPSFADILRG